MASVQFNLPQVARHKKFEDLKVNSNFKIASTHSRGAVYRKVRINHEEKFAMMEEETGMVFRPTQSDVSEVEVQVLIYDKDPGLYKGTKNGF